MVLIAAVWITMLLGVGGLALVQVLDDTLTASFDEQLANNLNAMINAAELDEVGDVRWAISGLRSLIPGFTGRYRAAAMRRFHRAACGIASWRCRRAIRIAARPASLKARSSPARRCG
jgi:hypothetical protein